MIKAHLSNSIGRLRVAGWIEGISWLILLFIGVPMKYAMDNPVMVKVFGPIHGGLFILLMLLAFISWLEKAITMKQGFMVFIASLIPFGPFFIDRRLADKEASG